MYCCCCWGKQKNSFSLFLSTSLSPLSSFSLFLPFFHPFSSSSLFLLSSSLFLPPYSPHSSSFLLIISVLPVFPPFYSSHPLLPISVSPNPLIKPLGPFQIFSKNSRRCLQLKVRHRCRLIIILKHLCVVELTYKDKDVSSLILFPLFSAGVVDTGGNLPPVLTLPPVSTTPAVPVGKICHRCR
jgi:hypothetical protein